MIDINFESAAAKHQKKFIDIFNYYIENSFAAYPVQKLPYAAFSMFLEIAKKYNCSWNIWCRGRVKCNCRQYGQF